MARFPEPGKTKTRLIPALGAEGAAQLHAALVHQTLGNARAFASETGCEVEVHFAGGDTKSMAQMFDPPSRANPTQQHKLDASANHPLKFLPQQGNSLGDRLNAATSQTFEQGAKRVVIIGTDCPDIDASILRNAFSALKHSNTVIGPATDGGYYLIGMTAHHRELFEGIDWGSDAVFEQTTSRANQAGVSMAKLNTLSDVDHPEDLIICRRHGGAFSRLLSSITPALISVVIPTLNEQENITNTLKQLLGVNGIEIIVADGGSTDRTRDIAREFVVRVVQSQPGRGRQMNAGAAVASGDILLFLHADTILPNGFADEIRALLPDVNHSQRDGQQTAIAGAFRLHIDHESFKYRIIEWGANSRSRWRKCPYGDQAIFIRSDEFYALNGYHNWPLMEEYELVQRVRKRGKITIAKTSVTTSSRRWQYLGALRTTLLNQLIILAYHCGISPHRLVKWYRGK